MPKLTEHQKIITKNLENAQKEMKVLQGLLPICASCKKIRDDRGYWKQLERFISEHSEAEFSHGICPACAERLYPDEYEDIKSEKVHQTLSVVFEDGASEDKRRVNPNVA